MCVCSIPYPLPLYLYEGATPGMQLFLAEPTLGASEEAPRGKTEVVGPMGQVGRPAHGSNDPQLLGVGLVWASSCLKVVARPVLTGFALVLGLHLIHLSLILHSDIFCDFQSGQSVLAPCEIGSKSPADILKHHMWNSLINKPILAFIPSDAQLLHDS